MDMKCNGNNVVTFNECSRYCLELGEKMFLWKTSFSSIDSNQLKPNTFGLFLRAITTVMFSTSVWWFWIDVMWRVAGHKPSKAACGCCCQIAAGVTSIQALLRCTQTRPLSPRRRHPSAEDERWSDQFKKCGQSQSILRLQEHTEANIFPTSLLDIWI